MLKRSEKNDLYRESDDFNQGLWDLKKKMFGLTRYIFNIIILCLGITGYYLIREYLTDVPHLSEYCLALALVLFLSVRISFEWERVPVLRFGKYIFTRGPGLFLIIPIVDKVIDYVDCRIMVTDFSAERVLTRDTVPVFVDAIIFWMVWDATKAKLEVEHYTRAVALSAKTALRDIIGKNSLSTLLSSRDGLGKQLQKILDKKTNPWGITSLSVEIKDIVIPTALEDAMSKEAQAEREKNARVILSQAEIEISNNFSRASEKYKNNDKALELRSLNLLLEALKKNGSMILVPSDVPSMMNIGTVAGIAKKIKKQGGDKDGDH
ncbi:MAG: slipin family protein [Spirochaetes bacterium]|nr:slipin family protein [Spirochaetota bacterium]